MLLLPIKSRSLVLTALFVPLLLLGLTPTDEKQAVGRLENVFEELLNRYVMEIDPEKLTTRTIDGMLNELDPYSEYILKSDQYQLDVLMKGQYGGVGIHLGRQKDSLVVIAAIAGSPAEKQGIRPGDIIIKIDSVWTKDLSYKEASKRVRGPQGQPVTLLIKRYGVNEALEFRLVRKIIRIEDITYSGMLEGDVGYVKLASFARFSAIHLEQEIRNLQRAGMTTFILDLRGNPGGLLNVALQISNLFLPQNEFVLETKGRLRTANKRYATTKPPVLPDMPMVVLIDQGSASASEIVAGILQDMDRAVILGTQSFGKGLVQTIYDIDDDASLKVTTAKYYLPSGRLIQKSEFGHGLTKTDSLAVDTLGFFTQNGRSMRGGGGISPDVDVAPILMDRYERQLWNKGFFFRYAVKYASEHPTITLPFYSKDETVESFRVWLELEKYHYSTDFIHWLNRAESLIDTTVAASDSLLELMSQVRRLAVMMEQQAFDANYDRIRLGIEQEVAAVVGGNSAQFAAGVSADLVLQEAIGLVTNPSRVSTILNNRAVAKSPKAD